MYIVHIIKIPVRLVPNRMTKKEPIVLLINFLIFKLPQIHRCFPPFIFSQVLISDRNNDSHLELVNRTKIPLIIFLRS